MKIGKKWEIEKQKDYPGVNNEGEDIIQWIYIILLAIFVGFPILRFLVEGWWNAKFGGR